MKLSDNKTTSELTRFHSVCIRVCLLTRSARDNINCTLWTFEISPGPQARVHLKRPQGRFLSVHRLKTDSNFTILHYLQKPYNYLTQLMFCILLPLRMPQ